MISPKKMPKKIKIKARLIGDTMFGSWWNDIVQHNKGGGSRGTNNMAT